MLHLHQQASQGTEAQFCMACLSNTASCHRHSAVCMNSDLRRDAVVYSHVLQAGRHLPVLCTCCLDVELLMVHAGADERDTFSSSSPQWSPSDSQASRRRGRRCELLGFGTPQNSPPASNSRDRLTSTNPDISSAVCSTCNEAKGLLCLL